MSAAGSRSPDGRSGTASLLADISLTSLNSEVYGPSEDSFALADALLDLSASWTTLPKLCVEIGCGSGYVLTSAARIITARGSACRLIGTDISDAALAATHSTLEAHKVAGVELVKADLLGPLLPGVRRQVDLLLFNPPYVPTPDEEVTRGGIAASWAGGARGRLVIDRLLAQLDDILAPGGEMLMVTVAENEPKGILREVAATAGFGGRICLTVRADEELLTILHIHR